MKKYINKASFSVRLRKKEIIELRNWLKDTKNQAIFLNLICSLINHDLNLQH